MASKNITCLRQSYQSLSNKLRHIHFGRHSVTSGFRQRKEQKLTGKLLLISFFLMALQGKNSLQLWAEKLSLIKGGGVSKQAVWKRMTAFYTKFLIAVLQEALRDQLMRNRVNLNNQFLRKCYQRVLIQDSTCIALPSCLCWCFPGNTSRGKRKAGLKIQVVYDLLSNQFIHLEITPFTTNDQSQSKKILSIAKEDDLVIRDLGYFVTDCFNQLLNEQIHFVSRLRFGKKLTELRTGKNINLLRDLRKHGKLDRWINIGIHETTAVRLVAMPLPQEIANRRRQKAKQDRDQRLKHSKEYYEQLGYSIFITSESNERFTDLQIAKLYSFRWRIETIFKCWKSHFHFQRLIPATTSMTQHRVEAIIYMLLIFCILFLISTYSYLIALGYSTISIVKLSRFIANNFIPIVNHKIKTFIADIVRYCSYEIRSDRVNFTQNLKLG